MCCALWANGSRHLAPGLQAGGQVVQDAPDDAIEMPVHLVGAQEPLAAAGSSASQFGVQWYGDVSTEMVDKVVDAGARWVRWQIAWHWVEPNDTTPANYDWSRIDASVTNAADRDIQLLITLAGQPAWAALYSMGPVTDTADLVEFVGALVERYDGDGVDDAPGSPRVRYFELYNEPDNASVEIAKKGTHGYWGRQGAEYASLLQTLYPVIKAASPQAQLVFGGLALDWFEEQGGPFVKRFLDDVLTACQGHDCFDAMNFHYYPYFRSYWEPYGADIMGKAAYVRQRLAAHGFGDAPLFCTETGWSGARWGNDELQSRYPAKGYVRAQAANLGMVIWYALTDGVDHNLPGLMTQDLHPKPAFAAYRVMNEMLDGVVYRRALTTAETGDARLVGYVFERNGKRLDVVWSEDDTPFDDTDDPVLPLTVDARALRVVDKFGGETRLSDADDGVIDGRIVLNVGGSPLYLEYEVLSDCRFGVGRVYHSVLSYTVSSLHAGWYLDWGVQTSPPQPWGLEHVQVLQTSNEGYAPKGNTLATAIAANPGALWLIGNEPDCIWQDNVQPQNYARVYHDAYMFIKARDPAARVAVGAIVQPTPLRMQYLDIVLDTYRVLYGESLPTDVWNMHSFILREASCAAYPSSCWGCEIPPGISAKAGMLYELDDTDNLDIFQERIALFRQWMRDRGYRDTPLVISEYGTSLPYYDPESLFYDSQGRPFDEARAKNFMYHTFDYLRTASDPDTGYPADENRLVQRWLWYSLDDSVGYGGALFDRVSQQILPLGRDFGAYTVAFSPTVDLVAVSVGQVGLPPLSPTGTVTLTLQARVSNIGNIAATSPITVRFLRAGGLPIGADQVITGGLGGCADVGVVTVVWPNVAPGAHPVQVVVDPDFTLIEDNKGNNKVSGVVLVARDRVFLPAVMKTRP